MNISTKKLDTTIPMLTASDQYQQDAYAYMGIDTEMLFTVNGKHVWPHLEGFKQERGEPGHNFDWHGDGYAFELCTPPVTCLEYMAGKLGAGLLSIHTQFESKGKVELDAPAVYKVPHSVQKTADDNVKRLGCAPSINVYGDAGSLSKLGESVRTTGCHLHITHPSLKKEQIALNLVQWADVLVGNVWNYVSPEPPKLEAMRRIAYGRAGEYRARLYPATENVYEARGVEYRVLPGSVIKNPAYLTLCFNLYRTALRFARDLGKPSEELTELSRKAINTADKELSAEIIHWLPFPEPAAKLLHILHAKPLPTLTPVEWHKKTYDHNAEGHRYLAVKEGLVDFQG
jgi:hypothetical protein